LERWCNGWRLSRSEQGRATGGGDEEIDPRKTPKEAVSEKSGSGSGDNGFRGLLEGQFGADGPLGEKGCSVGRKWVYIFNRRKAEKLIPGNT